MKKLKNYQKEAVNNLIRDMVLLDQSEEIYENQNFSDDFGFNSLDYKRVDNKQ